ncbi:MAG: glycosyltransferase family 2 protein [Alphaproteobacteria bacterium]|nr:glycosyltransferase family 2 protein [Alphaproteobacteria bacterium]
MRNGKRISVIIPALNEEDAIGKVIAEIPEWVDRVIVADNGSKDRTGDVAMAAGALVVREDEPGYGAACLAGISALPETDIVVFLDGDYSDYPADMALLVDPIVDDAADMVIGSRVLGGAERGSLTPQQVFGNWLATRLIRMVWGTSYSDLGPFRAIRREALQGLGMADRDYGWTVEMQVKAAKAGLRCEEVPVRYRKRIGVSKVSGTIKGTVKAGIKILSVIGWHALAGQHKTSIRAN